MGGLGRYLEEEGLRTTQISLIREHTAKINPPRALHVPFELGRPLGVPNDAEFQRQILLSALNLLEAPEGPLLEEFPFDAPATDEESGPLACPISFEPAELSEASELTRAFQKEIAGLATWYSLAKEQRGRTMADSSGLAIDRITGFLSDLSEGRMPENPIPGSDLPILLKAASEDLKAYYFEALTAQPGCARTSKELNDWFWSETAAGKVFREIKTKCGQSEDKVFALMADFCLVPRVQG